MATPNYDINYNDKRFNDVTNEKNNALNNINNTYNNMIESSDKFYQDQIQASKDYAQKQSEIQQANTNFAIEKIEQQKDQSRKDYIKEQTGAYTDWQKQSNQYGAKAEQMASQGLTNTGYSESSQISMYNTYQNRISSAKDSFTRATLEYDNAIKEAQLSNNSVLADIAYKALQTQLQVSLEGFQYKNTLLQTQINEQQETEDRYHQRWQDVLSQINTENQLKENIRQYETNLAYQKERDRIKDEQWQKEYNLSLASKYSSSGGKSSSSKKYEVETAFYQGKKAQNVGNYGYFSNGYQPKGVMINGKPYKLNDSGKDIKLQTVDRYGRNQTVTQTLWKAGGKNYYWDGRVNKYIEYK